MHSFFQVYCKSCFVKTFGEGSRPTIYSDTKVMAPSQGERGCRRCHGVVFELEKIVAGNHWFHQVTLHIHQLKDHPFKLFGYKFIKSENILIFFWSQNCFTCSVCRSKLDTLRVIVGKGGDVVCTTCNKIQMEEESRPSATIVRIPAEPGDPTACPRCQGKVNTSFEVIIELLRFVFNEAIVLKKFLHSI